MGAQLLTVDQAAGRLQVSRRHVVRMIEAGKLKAKDVGLGSHREYRIPESEIDSSLDDAVPIQQARKRRKPLGITDYL